jgi:hypothetical protein
MRKEVEMRFLHIVSRAAVMFLILSISACSGRPVPQATATNEPVLQATATSKPVPQATATNEPTPTPQATATSKPVPQATATSEPTEKEFEDFVPNNFDQSTNIDNEWLPLKPGTQWVFEGYTIDDNGDKVPHRLVITVTDLTKAIDGVRSVVTWDQDYKADQLVEGELAFFAQDKNGTVWRMGEHPEEYEDGEFVGAPTWIAGIADAVAGIEMQADPQPGMPSYSQGWAPAVDFTDRAQVSQINQKVCIPLDCYDDVLIMDETSKAEPGAHQLKYYVRGVGNIKVDWKGADETQETMELVKVVQLSPEALAEARAKALELEAHAYEVSKDVYGQTSPSE